MFNFHCQWRTYSYTLQNKTAYISQNKNIQQHTFGASSSLLNDWCRTEKPCSFNVITAELKRENAINAALLCLPHPRWASMGLRYGNGESWVENWMKSKRIRLRESGSNVDQSPNNNNIYPNRKSRICLKFVSIFIPTIESDLQTISSTGTTHVHCGEKALMKNTELLFRTSMYVRWAPNVVAES